MSIQPQYSQPQYGQYGQQAQPYSQQAQPYSQQAQPYGQPPPYPPQHPMYAQPNAPLVHVQQGGVASPGASDAEYLDCHPAEHAADPGFVAPISPTHLPAGFQIPTAPPQPAPGQGSAGPAAGPPAYMDIRDGGAVGGAIMDKRHYGWRTHSPEVQETEANMLQFFQTLNQRPQYLARVSGYHYERRRHYRQNGRRTHVTYTTVRVDDWSYNIDLSAALQQTGHLACAQEAVHHYYESKSSLRECTMQRTVEQLDTASISNVIAYVIRVILGYRFHVSVSYHVKDAQVKIQHPGKASRFVHHEATRWLCYLSCLWICWFPCIRPCIEDKAEFQCAFAPAFDINTILYNFVLPVVYSQPHNVKGMFGFGI